MVVDSTYGDMKKPSQDLLQPPPAQVDTSISDYSQHSATKREIVEASGQLNGSTPSYASRSASRPPQQRQLEVVQAPRELEPAHNPWVNGAANGVVATNSPPTASTMVVHFG